MYEDAYGAFPIPILAGVLPLASDRHAAFFTRKCPASTSRMKSISACNTAGEDGAREGIRIAIELIGQLKTRAQGIYLMPAFNRFDHAAEIIEAIKDQG